MDENEIHNAVSVDKVMLADGNARRNDRIDHYCGITRTENNGNEDGTDQNIDIKDPNYFTNTNEAHENVARVNG